MPYSAEADTMSVSTMNWSNESVSLHTHTFNRLVWALVPELLQRHG